MNKTTKRACEMALDTAIEAVAKCYNDIEAEKAALPPVVDGEAKPEPVEGGEPDTATILDMKLSTLDMTARIVYAIKEGILSGKVKMHKSVLGG
jgi:hypothetical protein